MVVFVKFNGTGSSLSYLHQSVLLTVRQSWTNWDHGTLPQLQIFTILCKNHYKVAVVHDTIDNWHVPALALQDNFQLVKIDFKSIAFERLQETS